MGQVAISLNGRTYRFTCGDGEESRITELASYVSGKLRALGQEFGRPGDDRMLIMAALMLADEVFEARAQVPAPTPIAGRTGAPDPTDPGKDELRAAVPGPRTRKPSLASATSHAHVQSESKVPRRPSEQ
jgi:cell division protein ZapA